MTWFTNQKKAGGKINQKGKELISYLMTTKAGALTVHENWTG